MNQNRLSDVMIGNIVKVFLFGRKWQKIPMGDKIIDPDGHWCRWRDVQRLRKVFVNEAKGCKKIRWFGLELEALFKEMDKPDNE